MNNSNSASQPTVSSAPAWLRRHFGDELLTRVKNAYEFTLVVTAMHLATFGRTPAGLVRDAAPHTSDRKPTGSRIPGGDRA
ncbi:hypothetical protein [Streptomyces sp. NPDC050759]|uniref:hypothetical protein n=1 Tax=Streptomyces sp. NPDC050759 TaxID=3365635 RepID=UPI003788B5A8